MSSKKSIAGPIMVALAFILGACGDDDAESDTTEAAAEPEGTAAAEPTAAPSGTEAAAPVPAGDIPDLSAYTLGFAAGWRRERLEDGEHEVDPGVGRGGRDRTALHRCPGQAGSSGRVDPRLHRAGCRPDRILSDRGDRVGRRPRRGAPRPGSRSSSPTERSIRRRPTCTRRSSDPTSSSKARRPAIG